MIVFEIAFEYAVNEKRDDADANNNPLYGLPHKYEVRGGGEAAENWSDEQWGQGRLIVVRQSDDKRSYRKNF